MRRLYFVILSVIATLTASAQANYMGLSSGYYRVQNKVTTRYIIVTNNKAGLSGGEVDYTALQTVKDFKNVVSEPGSVIYIENAGGTNGYVLYTQGTNTYSMVGEYIKLYYRQSENGYWCYATKSGATKYLSDDPDDGVWGMVNDTYSKGRTWTITPVTQADKEYFGLAPNVNVGNQYYQTFFADFPFSFASTGRKAYYVETIDTSLGIAVMAEISGTVPKATPVIICSTSNQTAQNKLNVGATSPVNITGNLLTGTYFDRDDNAWNIHNYVANDQQTMRLIGKTSNGSIGFVTSNLKAVPHNTAYLKVPAGSPAEFRLMTKAEYEQIKNNDAVTVTAKSYTRNYGAANPAFEYTVSGTGTLRGTPQLTCNATANSPVGTYPIVVSKGTVQNNSFTGVNGTLTVTKVPLTISVGNYTMKETDAIPTFTINYQGFVAGDNENALTKKPTITTNIPANKAPGTYDLIVSGAESPNYNITYVAGKLTITEADPITIRATSVEMEYGNAVPTLTYTVEGGTITGTPTISCTANSNSPAGTYPITVSAGTVNYPRLLFVAGTLTINKAPLTISAGNYTMKQTDERPVFKAQYEGFKLNETESVLTSQPILTTNAPANNTPGEYEISVSGASAANYDISYRSGKLIITEADQIVIMAHDASMVYGDAVPTFHYTVEGGTVTGEPTISCEASSRSSVGNYAIIIEKGNINYPNLKLVNANLSITKAPLTASVGNYSRRQGKENPTFVINYDGFRNGDTEEVFIKKPVATTDAEELWCPVGEYVITVSGGEAENYEFSYVNGILTVEVGTTILPTTMSLPHPVDIYTLTGRMVRSSATTLEGLPKGIYIIEGKRVAISK